MKTSSSSGFSILHILPILAVIGIVGFVGYKIMKSSSAQTSVSCTFDLLHYDLSRGQSGETTFVMYNRSGGSIKALPKIYTQYGLSAQANGVSGISNNSQGRIWLKHKNNGPAGKRTITGKIIATYSNGRTYLIPCSPTSGYVRNFW